MIGGRDRLFLHEDLAHDLSGVRDKRIALCGCGAIGSNLAVGLTRRGFGNFLLIDNDRIEAHNIGTQVWFDHDVGKFKARILANILYSISFAKAIPYEKRVESLEHLEKVLVGNGGADLVIDSFDNREARAATRQRDFPVLHVGMSGEGTAEISWDENYTLPIDVDLEDPCAYPLARSLVEITVANAASIVIDFFLRGVRRGKYIDNSHVV